MRNGVSYSRTGILLACMVLLTFAAAVAPVAQEYTRGIGVYPGNVNETFAPSMRIDSDTYRNLAYLRPAYHSSSYDYNLTAQLVTDGIKDTNLPRWISTSTSDEGVLLKNQRVYFLDTHQQTSVSMDGPYAWMQLEIGGGDLPRITSINLDGSQRTDADVEDHTWTIMVLGSDDGETWDELGRLTGETEPPEQPAGGRRGFGFFGFGRGPAFDQTVELTAPARNRFYRVQLDAENTTSWQFREVNFYDGENRVIFGGPQDFTSAWMSEGNEKEWVYVDLGAECSFDRIVLDWIQRPAIASVEVSGDAENWTTLRSLPTSDQLTDDIHLSQAARGRYVRVLMTRPMQDQGYILSEMEVYGRGGPVAVPHPAPAVKSDGRLDLAGGNWRIQRDNLVMATGETVSRAGFQDDSWNIATVPGTVLVSYWNIGALPDPNYGANQLYISDSFFYSDFWYRTEFTAPSSYNGKRVHLNLDGINWKADIYLNGRMVGHIDGAFMRGKYDVTDLLVPGQTNAVAVRLIKNDTPGHMKQKTFANTDVNGGTLGGDNPTYHASIGWDWIPTVRGRNDGIWDDVYMTTSGPVTIEDPFVTTDLPLPDTTYADIHVETTLVNHTNQAVRGTLRATYGDVTLEQPVTLAASESQTVTMTPQRMRNPKLWWPAGYGNQDLYDVQIQFLAGNNVSDTKSFMSGVREMAYTEDDNILRIYINGRRFIGRGGNWGFPESMLLYRGREYDAAVKYHADMHFTMIRNWVGQTADKEFYEACDRWGVMVWQDFWLANPVDGPNPYYPDMFLANARDFVKKIRNHPSIAIYVGRNEGNPPPEIDDPIREEIIPQLHPGLHYISNSAFGVVSGGGPYRAQETVNYFRQRATPKLHSEMGMPNIVNYESLQLMMPEESLWPMGLDWGIHDFTLAGAQGGVSFIQRIEDGFGPADDARDWTELAQWINYEGYRAMFEAQSRYRMGLLLWMSHPCWPSFVWQTYDYYFEPTAGYFGSKKGTEPLHIQWNALTDSVEVVNYSVRGATGLTASVQLLNMDGSVQWEKTTRLDSPEDSNTELFPIEYPAGLTSVYYMKLKLMRGNEVVSDNFYWRGLEEGNYRALWELPQVELDADTDIDRDGDTWMLTTRLRNTTDTPALMVRLKVVRRNSGDRILPVLYDDNYISLMPGEERTIEMQLFNADTRGERPAVVVSGFNLAE